MRALTRAEIEELPAAVPLWPDAARALGIGRSKAYELVAAGEWPTRIHRLGNAYRVPTAELRAFLGLGDAPQGPDAA